MLRETRAGLRAAVKPVIPKLQQSARERLPKTGGLNEHVAGQVIQVQTRLVPGSAYVRLRAPFYDAKQTNKGYVRHPRFGDRTKGNWFATQIPQARGWFDDVMHAEEPAITVELTAVQRRIAAKIQAAT